MPATALGVDAGGERAKSGAGGVDEHVGRLLGESRRRMLEGHRHALLGEQAPVRCPKAHDRCVEEPPLIATDRLHAARCWLVDRSGAMPAHEPETTAGKEHHG